jgi:mono/diheme cytochrome c family protein
LLALQLQCLTPALLAAASKATVDFDRDIRPILSDHCSACHGPDKEKRKGGLRLDVKEDAFRKLDSGRLAIVAGRPKESRLLEVIALPLDDDDHMPPRKSGKQLSAAQIELLRRWVEQGAPWAAHWSYTSPHRPAPPQPRARKWAQHDLDRFVLARLEKEGLRPNPSADRPTLLRRVALDLTGLPPTLQEVDDFVQDPSPRAYEKVVEHYLASPHFGERLALAWLDQARYADTSGYHFDGFRQMHLWRDWVIQAFNQNKPFDQFTIEQLAGDLLPDATMEQKIATGFHRNVMTNDEGGADPEEYLAKYVVDRVSTTAQVWLGTTFGCAECHDHKYDPLSHREFYQFYAFFHNVPEKGLDGTRVRNPGPVLKVPTPLQGSKLLGYVESVPEAEKKLAERQAELPKAQQLWEEQLRNDAQAATNASGAEPPGLLLAYSFDGSIEPDPRTNAHEASGSHGRGSTNEITQHRWVPGRLAQALALDSNNDVVRASPPLPFSHTNAFSYGGWVKLQGKTGAVLSQMDEAPSYRGFDLLVNELKLEVHLVHQFPENAVKVVTKEPLRSNVWQHVFVTYNGNSKAAGITLYVDGQRRAVDAPIDKLTNSLAAKAPLLLGGRLNAFPFHGLLDEIRFYDRALSASEVSALATAPLLRVAARPPAERTDEEQADLKRFFREQRATDFLAAQVQLSRLKKEKEELQAAIADTMVMQELEKPRDTFVLMRGNFQQKGEKVTANTPACWPPLPPEQPANRLTLARWLVSTNQPLTARVIVNRYWAMLFGTGLVKTGNDFGSQGERPSHPELLDWLACEFMNPQVQLNPGSPAGAWDVKHLLRLLVTSATYRQAATVTEEKLRRDPNNRLLSRGPRVRLEAELIRDNALAVSGLLNETIGGPSIKPYQPPGIWDVTDHKYEQSHGRELYRRGIYVFWKRAAYYPSFQTFDAPSRETCTLTRPRTSTPLQSLVVMNDPVYVEAARVLAARTIREGGADLRQQLTYAFRLALARPPAHAELETLQRTYRQQRDHFLAEPKSASALLAIGESPAPQLSEPAAQADLAAMTGVANVLLNLNETLNK